MTHRDLIGALSAVPDPDALWSGDYKIPWNDPDFSRRMLREHLDQGHDLASRRLDTVRAQAQWLLRGLPPRPSRVLDLGCGPGLYAPHFTAGGHAYLGLDFGPASVAHARERFAAHGRCEFVLADVREADFRGPHDLAMMLYGEINVFAPHEAGGILRRARAALAPGGRIVVEGQSAEAVRRSGRGESWYAAPSGLFSDGPHLCLSRGHWFSRQATAVQCFFVLGADGGLRAYRSTTRAYAREDYAALFREAGFTDIRFHADWPMPDGEDSMLLVSAARP